ncbi:MAG TPA: DUF924 family protein [Allosphingosinicella sp.]|uniref:DUF924 family protein n=1 Tax=Allosphingosinicella sp. TaxID=2823234 RepID=UPI002ED96ABC
MAEPCVSKVLDYWFGLEPEQWWKPDPELDAEVRERFHTLWEEQSGRQAEDFLGSAEEALAAIILLDQFPRNMFRDHADQFATDHLALQIAKAAVERGYDETFEQPRRGFLYMPFQHSEDLEDQQRSVALFTALSDDYQLGFAKKHHDVIERFGRFPHRNAILGRTPRPDEVAAGDVFPW